MGLPRVECDKTQLHLRYLKSTNWTFSEKNLSFTVCLSVENITYLCEQVQIHNILNSWISFHTEILKLTEGRFRSLRH